MQFVFSIRDAVCYSPVLSIKIVTSTYRFHNAENIHFLVIVLCWVSAGFNGSLFFHFVGIYIKYIWCEYWENFCPSTLVAAVSIVPTVRLPHVRLHVALARSTNYRDLGTFQKLCCFGNREA
jgi:hypothetical protein